MTERKIAEGPGAPKRCQATGAFDGAFSPCARPGQETVDGLLLCEGHTLEARLEGQVACWDEVLFHLDLWSREAGRRDRADVVRLLEVQRAEAAFAMEEAREDLDRARGQTYRGSGKSWRAPTKGPPLPPEGVRPLSRGLRRR